MILIRPFSDTLKLLNPKPVCFLFAALCIFLALCFHPLLFTLSLGYSHMWHLPRSSDPLTQTWRVVVVWSCGPRLVPVLGLRQSALAKAFSPLRTSFPGHRLRQQRTASALFALPLLLHLFRFLNYALYVL